MASTSTPVRKRITIHTDGSCLGNPGPGGWACLLTRGNRQLPLAGGVAETTNNRMELLAAIKALEALKLPGRLVTLITDSKYVMDGVTQWLPKWKANGWRTSAKKPVKNQDLWERLDGLTAAHDITWKWVKGHSGDWGNEIVDRAAREAAERAAVEGDIND
jgi:ribonuclease HI